MKKYSLLKILIISFLAMIFLTWIIPIGIYGASGIEIGEIQPLGIFDIFYIPFYTLLAYFEYGAVIILIGALYGVLNKVGLYNKLVDLIVEKIKDNKNLFLIISTIVFSLITSLTGLIFPILVFVPLVITVTLKLGYDKLTAFSISIGAMLIGMVGSTFGLNTTIYDGAVIATNIFKGFGLKLFDNILVRLIIYVIVLFLYIVMIVSKKKEVNKKSDVKIPLYQEVKKSKESVSTLIMILSFLFLLLIFLMYNWDYITNKTLFDDMYVNMTKFDLGGVPIFSYILGGSLTVVGAFGNIHLITILFISILIIGWIYNISLEELIDGAKNGAKGISKVAFYVIFANIIMSVVTMISSGSIIISITNWLANLFSGFNVIISTLIGLVGGLFYNNFYEFLLDSQGVLYSFANSHLSVLCLIIQSVFNLMMMIMPTSILLIFGLSYLDIKYKDWLKHIWIYLIQILLIVIIISQIVYMVY